MFFEKNVKVTNHGMINLPAKIRQEYHIKDGDYVSIIKDEDGIRLIPILPIKELKENSVSVEEMREELTNSRKHEMELESRNG